VHPTSVADQGDRELHSFFLCSLEKPAWDRTLTEGGGRTRG
jgi:hypothetical protein